MSREHVVPAGKAAPFALVDERDSVAAPEPRREQPLRPVDVVGHGHAPDRQEPLAAEVLEVPAQRALDRRGLRQQIRRRRAHGGHRPGSPEDPRHGREKNRQHGHGDHQLDEGEAPSHHAATIAAETRYSPSPAVPQFTATRVPIV